MMRKLLVSIAPVSSPLSGCALADAIKQAGWIWRVVDGIWIGGIFVAQETAFISIFKGLQHDTILSSILFTCRFDGCFTLGRIA